MLPGLVKAHQALDKAVDLCYSLQPFANELSRIEFLFGLYDLYTAPIFKKRRSNEVFCCPGRNGLVNKGSG